MPTVLTDEALQGYRAADDAASPYYETSSCDGAWQVGRYLASIGADAPAKVTQGRGYRVNVTTIGGMRHTFEVVYSASAPIVRSVAR